MEDRSLDGFFAGCGFAGGLFAVCVELGVEEVAFEEVESSAKVHSRLARNSLNAFSVG